MKHNRRATRVNLNALPNPLPNAVQSILHDVEFRFHNPSLKNHKIHLFNLSVSGVGFNKSDGKVWPQTGEHVHGALVFSPGSDREESHEFQARVVRSTSVAVGCAFESPSAELTSAIQKYFAVEMAAIQLHEVPNRVLASDPEGTPHWFHCQQEKVLHELYFIESQGTLVRFHMSFFGHFLEGSVNGPLHHGVLLDEPASDKPHYKGSNLVSPQRNSTVTGDIRWMATRFLEQVQGLNPRLRKQIIQCLQSATQAAA